MRAFLDVVKQYHCNPLTYCMVGLGIVNTVLAFIELIYTGELECKSLYTVTYVICIVAGIGAMYIDKFIEERDINLDKIKMKGRM